MRCHNNLAHYAIVLYVGGVNRNDVAIKYQR